MVTLHERFYLVFRNVIIQVTRDFSLSPTASKSEIRNLGNRNPLFSFLEYFQENSLCPSSVIRHVIKSQHICENQSPMECDAVSYDINSTTFRNNLIKYA